MLKQHLEAPREVALGMISVNTGGNRGGGAAGLPSVPGLGLKRLRSLLTPYLQHCFW